MTLLHRLQQAVLGLVLALTSGLNASVTSYTLSTPVTTPGTYEPISGGTIHSILHTDGVSPLGKMTNIPIGFYFPFDGMLADRVKLTSDGTIVLNNAAGPTAAPNNSLEVATGNDARRLIAPLWDDLDGCGGGANFQTKIEGVPGSRVFIAQWDRWHWPSTNDDSISFQARLYEMTGVIRFYYKAGPNAPVGASASVGLSGLTVGDFLSVDALSASATASSAVANNSISSLDESELMLEFVPSPMTPHSNVIISPSGTSATVSFTRSTHPQFRGTRALYSEDGGATWRSTYGVYSTLQSSFIINTLGWNSNYILRLIAYNDGNAVYVDTPFSTLTGTSAATITVGGTSVSDSLTGALAACASQGLAGPTTIELAPSYSTTFETFPIAFGALAGHGSPLTIRPAAGATNLVITRAGAYPTISLVAARYVTIDGRPGGSGGEDGDARPLSSNLTISNTFATAAANTGTVVIGQNTRYNTLTHLNVTGRNPSDVGGVVTFHPGATVGEGIDLNTIKNCMISSGAPPVSAFAACGFMLGSQNFTSSELFLTGCNEGNTVTDCDFRDLLLDGDEQAAIRTSGPGFGNRILANRIYQTAARTYTAASTMVGIHLGTMGGDNLVASNVIGPNPSGFGPAAWTTSGDTSIVGIQLNVGDARQPTIVSDNIIQSIDQTTTGLGNFASGHFTGILLNSQPCPYVIDGNTIGSLTSANSIRVLGTNPSASAFASTVGIRTGRYSTFEGTFNTLRIANNRIGGITASNSGGLTASCAVYGYWDLSNLNGRSDNVNTFLTLEGNEIGTPSAPILAGGSSSNSGTTDSAGIVVDRTSASSPGAQLYDMSGTAAIVDNTIRGIFTRQDPTSSNGIGGSVRGISVGFPGSAPSSLTVARISGNTISQLRAQANHWDFDFPSVAGIQVMTDAGGQVIEGNVLHDITATPSADGSVIRMSVVGIYADAVFELPRFTISRNRIYGLDNRSVDPEASIFGINYGRVTAIVENNMISPSALPNGSGNASGTLAIHGIRDFGDSTASEIEHNSVAMYGLVTGSGNGEASCLLREYQVPSGAVSIQNNILVNTRNPAGATGLNACIMLETAANLTMNGNIYAIGGPVVLGTLGSPTPTPSFNLSDWRVATGQEAQSQLVNMPSIADPSIADLHIAVEDYSVVERLNVAGGLTLVDFDGELRSSFDPQNVDIGADAGDFDRVGPTITMMSTEPDPTTAAGIYVTAGVSEILGFTASDIVVSGTANAVLSDPHSSPSIFGFTLIPQNVGSILVQIPAGVATDWAGNPNLASSFSRNSTIPVELSAFTLE